MASVSRKVTGLLNEAADQVKRGVSKVAGTGDAQDDQGARGAAQGAAARPTSNPRETADTIAEAASRKD